MQQATCSNVRYQIGVGVLKCELLKCMHKYIFTRTKLIFFYNKTTFYL